MKKVTILQAIILFAFINLNAQEVFLFDLGTIIHQMKIFLLAIGIIILEVL